MALPSMMGHYSPRPGHVFARSAWVFFERTSRHGLFIGTLTGKVYLWDWNDSEEVIEITSLVINGAYYMSFSVLSPLGTSYLNAPTRSC